MSHTSFEQLSHENIKAHGVLLNMGDYTVSADLLTPLRSPCLTHMHVRACLVCACLCLCVFVCARRPSYACACKPSVCMSMCAVHQESRGLHRHAPAVCAKQPGGPRGILPHATSQHRDGAGRCLRRACWRRDNLLCQCECAFVTVPCAYPGLCAMCKQDHQ